VLLSCHSQGSVLGAVVLMQVGTPTSARTAFLTYGCPLARLYGRFFPAYFSGTALDRLGGFLRDADATPPSTPPPPAMLRPTATAPPRRRRRARHVALAQPVPAQRPDRRGGVRRPPAGVVVGARRPGRRRPAAARPGVRPFPG
jgi:hypothetical protein